MEFLSLSGAAIAVIVIVAVVAVLVIGYVLWYISTKNKLISLRNDTEESFSAMDVHLKKRHDLIPNLVETCKGYAKHESETFEKIAQARRVAISAAPADRAAAEAALSSSLHTLLNAVSEKYPELKADSQFNGLSAQLEQCEHEIANSRKYYNAKIKIFNNKIEQFPSSIVANKMHLERKSYFELDDAMERNAPTVTF